MPVPEKQRANENNTSKLVETTINLWENIMADPANMDASNGDTCKETFSHLHDLLLLKLPTALNEDQGVERNLRPCFIFV
jgi:hypothetical protein